MNGLITKIKNAPEKKTALLIFIVSFVWIFSLTYNFPFFWEDSFYIENHTYIQQNPDEYSFQNLISLFFDALLNPRQFYTICYNGHYCRSMLYDSLYPTEIALFGLDVFFYHIERAFLFALYISSSFFFFNKIKNDALPGLLFPSLIIFSLLIVPEHWVMVLYLTDPLPYVLVLTTFTLGIFYFFYNDDAIQNKVTLCILFLLIILFTQISILLSHIGRVYVIIIFLFLLFSNRKKLLMPRHALLLLTLIFLSVPILGLIHGLFSIDLLGYTRDLSSPITAPLEESLSFIFVPNNIFTFFINLPYSFFNHNSFLFLLLLIFICFHMYNIIRRKIPESNDITHSLQSLALLSFFWFLLTAFLLFLARGFVHPPLFFLRFQFSLFIVPQTLFVLSYCSLIYKKYFSTTKSVYYLILFFVFIGIISNLFLLNAWRGGWGAYLLGYDTVRQYIDEHAENSLLVLPYDHASPLYFVPPSTNQHIMIDDLTNTTLLSSYQQNYSHIYIASRNPLLFDSSAVINVANLTIRDTSPYGLLKKLIGRGYAQPMYVYLFENTTSVRSQ